MPEIGVAVSTSWDGKLRDRRDLKPPRQFSTLSIGAAPLETPDFEI